MAAPELKLNNGRSMPALGLGTWLAPAGEVGRAVKCAIDAGYRHFDCALLYQNEQEIGEAIKDKIAEGVVKREDVFITSKLWNTYHRPDLVVKGCQKTLRNFGLDYIDLYLIHWPIGFKATNKADIDGQDIAQKEQIFEDDEFAPRDATGNIIFSDDDYVDTWKQMEQCVHLGLTRSIGVSNFNVIQLKRVIAAASIKPVTNQIEVHPYMTQANIRNYCREQEIVVTGYCPLGATKNAFNCVSVSLLDNPKLLQLAQAVNKTPAQVALRYLVQLGVVPIPKSTNPERLRQNISVFDFQLTPQQMQLMETLENNTRICLIPGTENHKYHPF